MTAVASCCTQALASTSSRRTSGGGDGDGADDVDASLLVTRSGGSSFSHRSPVAVPQQLEVEYSRASQESQQSMPYCDEEAGQQAASTEASGSPLGGATGYSQAGDFTPQSSPAAGAPLSPGSEALAFPAQEGQATSPDEALLLCSALNTAGGEGLGRLRAPSPHRSPPAVRLWREVQRELSGTVPYSPMLAAMVSEHSFEEGEALQAFASGSSPRDTSASPTTGAAAGSPQSPGPAWLNSAAAQEAGCNGRPGCEDEPPADMLSGNKQAGATKRVPLHRAVTPITAALGEELPGSSKGLVAKGRERGEQRLLEVRSAALYTCIGMRYSRGCKT